MQNWLPLFGLLFDYFSLSFKVIYLNLLRLLHVGAVRVVFVTCPFLAISLGVFVTLLAS